MTALLLTAVRFTVVTTLLFGVVTTAASGTTARKTMTLPCMATSWL